jgi:hypothetical protein
MRGVRRKKKQFRLAVRAVSGAKNRKKSTGCGDHSGLQRTHQ